MRNPAAPKNQKQDSTDSWPFIRWIESRQRWQVDARTATGGKRTFHKTKNEAEGAAAAARVLKANEGSSAFDARELVQLGWTVQRAIRFAVEHLKKQRASVPIETAIEKLIESKTADGCSTAYLRTLKANLHKLATAFPGRLISSITTADIQSFLSSLPLAPATRNTIRRDVVNLWSFSTEIHKWAERNEAENTSTAISSDESPAILTPKQAADLLAASKDDVRAFLSIGLFAGLRVSEIKRLDWADVDLAGGFVHVSAKKAKTRTRRIVPILDALRAWITPVAKTSGPIIQPNFRRRSTAVRKAAKIKEWPDNGMRHSFVSYRLASTNDAAKTALESGHDQAIMFSNYREIVKPKDAERYFSIRPSVAEPTPSGSPREARVAAIRRLEMGRQARRKAKTASKAKTT